MENLVYQVFGVVKHKGLIWSVIISSILFTSCGESVKEPSTVFNSIEIHGETQGTTYTVIVVEKDKTLDKAQLDSLFSSFDMVLSTYIDESIISQFNNCQDSIVLADNSHLFERCYRSSQHVYSKTKGLFDPSVYPLVKSWGFMNNMNSPLSKKEVKDILDYVSFEAGKHHNLIFTPEGKVLGNKYNANFKLDMNAIAQGLSVDVVDEFLKSKGCSNYFIEIGGELIVRGHNREGDTWRIGVDVPKENLATRELENIILVSEKAIATSGNYRKFYVKDGLKYAHTLNPLTGFPVQHSLLSVTVIAETCDLADGYATAFMVMGTEKTLSFVKNNPDEKLEVYLLFSGEDGEIERAMSEGFEKYLKK